MVKGAELECPCLQVKHAPPGINAGWKSKNSHQLEVVLPDTHRRRLVK